MNKLVFGALALTLTSTAGFASDNEWLSLDQEIDALASSLTVQGGAGIGGWIGANYSTNSDTNMAEFGTVGRFNVTGSVGDYGYKVSIDHATGDGDGDGLMVRDAYVSFPCGDAITTTFGQFKQPYNRSGLISGNRLLFIGRTDVARAGRSEGIMVSGSFDALDWAVSMQDNDGVTDDETVMTVRATFDLMGDGVGNVEGAYGAGDGMNATIGVAMSDDSAADTSDTNIEFNMTGGAWSIGAEMDDDDASGDTATAITGSYMLTPDTWELAVRMENDGADGSDDDIRFGVNKYVSGHDCKWQFDYDSGDDTDTISVGVLVSF
ncbi:MAG: porin [Planctomycetota bacterium]|nr:porin [Planctomycetota bacterium]